ncbi:hypothetical protein NP493_5g02081 [Ridgeia piscesae]|uniref:Uncharacterized protein n=1 Tax=Ridgeia piscesae TaxID=27915 RepID=A0AAD9PFT1_RIDPI|nr:hypothetical protein NP493_5g02081 [Ridgeia piscesae]
MCTNKVKLQIHIYRPLVQFIQILSNLLFRIDLIYTFHIAVATHRFTGSRLLATLKMHHLFPFGCFGSTAEVNVYSSAFILQHQAQQNQPTKPPTSCILLQRFFPFDI